MITPKRSQLERSFITLRRADPKKGVEGVFPEKCTEVRTGESIKRHVQERLIT